MPPIDTVVRIPARGVATSTIRIARGLGHRIGMFDPKTERFQEWTLPTPFAMPYDEIFDNSTYAWTGGMGNGSIPRQGQQSVASDGRGKDAVPHSPALERKGDAVGI
jgi:streptogramin lyase